MFFVLTSGKGAKICDSWRKFCDESNGFGAGVLSEEGGKIGKVKEGYVRKIMGYALIT
jgi:hypothetical protein